MIKSNELKNCNSIKAILMLMIVLYHSMALYMDGGWGPFDEPIQKSIFIGHIAEWFNSFHIYGFTLVSGYIFYFIKHEKEGYQKYTDFFKNKAKRLLIPYVFVAAIWIIPVYCYFYGTDSVIEKFILATGPNQLWFLLMLFWVFAGFWWISDLVDKYPLVGGIICCVCYGIGLIFPNYFCIAQAFRFVLFFYIGFMIRKSEIVNKLIYKIPNIIYLILDIALFCTIQLLDPFESVILKVIKLGLNVLLHIVGAIGSFVILQRTISRFLLDNKVLSFLARHSMTVYLVHQQLIYFTISWFHNLIPPILLVLINFAFALTISLLISVLMFKTKITRFLIGSK